eukprot:gene3388-2342_t
MAVLVITLCDQLAKHVQHVLRIDCYSGWECVNSEMLLHTLQLFLVEWTIVVNAVWIKVWYLDYCGKLPWFMFVDVGLIALIVST